MNVSFLIHKHSGLIAGLALVAVGFLVHGNSFSGAFIFDDYPAIISNPKILSLWPPWEPFIPPAYTPVRDRPVVNFTLAVNYALSELNTWSYHLLNLLIHLSSSLVLFAVLRRTFTNPILPERYARSATILSLSTALLWMVHPLQTESVIYIIQRQESLCGLFYLLTLYCFIRGSDSRFGNAAPRDSGDQEADNVSDIPGRSNESVRQSMKSHCEPHRGEAISKNLINSLYANMMRLLRRAVYPDKIGAPRNDAKNDKNDDHRIGTKYRRYNISPRAWFAASVIFCALGMGTKAVMVTAPLIVLIYDSIFISRSLRRALNRRWVFYLFLASTWLIQLFMLVTVSYADIKTHGVLEYALTQPGVILHYLKLSFLPFPLCLDYGWEASRKISEILPSLVPILGLLAATIWTLFKKPAIGFLGIWFFLILAPTSSLLPLEDIAFEHRLYLPLASLVVLAVVGGYELLLFIFPAEKRVRAILSSWLLIMIALYLSILTVARNRDYASPVRIWAKVLAHYPGNYRAHFNLGQSLSRIGKIEEAAQHYRDALRLRPSYLDARLNLGIYLFRTGNPEEALEEFNIASEIDSGHPGVYLNLGKVYASQGKTELALENLQKALSLRPDFPEAYNNLASIFLELNEPEKAASYCQRAIELNPRLPESHYNLAIAFFIMGDFSRASSGFYQAHLLQPENLKTLNNLGNALAAQGKLAEAEKVFRDVLRRDPDFPEARSNLGDVLIQQGKFEAGLKFYRSAVEKNPDSETDYEVLARTLDQLGRYGETVSVWESGLSRFPDNPVFLNNLAWLLATCPEAEIRDCTRAISLARQANSISGEKDFHTLDTLAAAHAACGQFELAREIAARALELAESSADENVSDKIRERLNLYKQNLSYQLPVK